MPIPNEGNPVDVRHPDLQLLRNHLEQIHDAISNFRPLTDRPPIVDSSIEMNPDTSEDIQWLQQEHIPGVKKLKESIKIDLDVLEKFLNDPASAHLPPLSTNAPYLIAVWNELLCAPPPIVSVFKSFPFEPVQLASTRKRGTQKQPGVKVDIVADNGRNWIRINTVKNSRLLAEFREIDSYLTDSEDDDDDDNWDEERPTLAQTEFDNSVLRMGRSLLAAASANPIEGTTDIPRVTLRLTRLNPSLSGDESDPRILKTLDTLRSLGIYVKLGGRTGTEIDSSTSTRSLDNASPPLALEPTLRINLDLSVLIALISDLTHAALPATVEEANIRFIPPQQYREWKQQRQQLNGKIDKERPHNAADTDADITDVSQDFIKHTRALTNQLLQEMGKGLLQEMRDRLHRSAKASSGDTSNVEFWTTPEARDRCLRIVSKIGGPNEKRRAKSLFFVAETSSQGPPPLSESERLYWLNSRYPLNFIPLLPIHLYPTSTIPEAHVILEPPLKLFNQPETFFRSLGKTCKDILAQETALQPQVPPDNLVHSEPAADLINTGEIQRATVTKANARLTEHTVKSMLWGAELGWTTLTANRTSVKAILREMKLARVAGRLFGPEAEAPSSNQTAAIWIVDPRSLAEGMSSQA